MYLNKQSSKYVRTFNVFNLEHSIKSLYKLLSSYSDKAYSELFRTFKMEPFAKRIMPKWLNMHQYPKISLNILENA